MNDETPRPGVAPRAPSSAAQPAARPRRGALEPGARLGRYSIIRLLAIGGMAEIYLARTGGLSGFEKTVVIKRILPEYASTGEFVGMFLNEARVAMTLQHPNVVQTYDVGEVDGSYFMVMEYLHGENLGTVMQAVLQRKQRLPLEHALNVMVSVCSGLHYAHEHVGADGRPLDLIHRDVTPQNILVTYQGGVKLIDFGVAKAANSGSQTRCGTLKGKLAYMSPEQCVAGALDRRSDIFSLGVVLHEVTIARRLFASPSDFETLKKIVELPIPAPRDLDPAYPPALETIVMRALHKDPGQRYQTAREMQLDLEAFAHESRLQLSPTSLQTFVGGLFDGRERERQRFGEQPVRDLRPAGEDGAGAPDDLELTDPSAAADPPALVGEPSLEIEIVTTPPRRPWRRALVGVLAVATLGAGAALALPRLYPERVAAWFGRGAPAAQAPAAAGAPGSGTPAAVGAPASGPASAPVLAVLGSSQPTSAAAARDAGAGAVAAGPAAARELGAVGILQVVTRPPGARLFLDGKELSERSPTTVGGVPAGSHHALFVQLPGYRDTMVTAAVRAGKVTPLVVRLQRDRGAAGRDRARPGEAAVAPAPPPVTTPAPRPRTEAQGDGTLVLASSPWCNVSVDGKDRGPTPLTLKLAAGPHTVVLSNAEFRIRRTLSIHITAGQTVRKSLDFGVE